MLSRSCNSPIYKWNGNPKHLWVFSSECMSHSLYNKKDKRVIVWLRLELILFKPHTIVPNVTSMWYTSLTTFHKYADLLQLNNRCSIICSDEQISRLLSLGKVQNIYRTVSDGDLTRASRLSQVPLCSNLLSCAGVRKQSFWSFHFSCYLCNHNNMQNSYIILGKSLVIFRKNNF